MRNVFATAAGLFVLATALMAAGGNSGGDDDSSSDSSSDDTGTLVLNLRGTGTAYAGTVPDIDGDGIDDPANCFDVGLYDLGSGDQLGTATDCLANVTDVGGSIALTGTSYFNFNDGSTLVTRGATTVQPATHGLTGFTHITGAAPTGTGDILSGTGDYAGATGSARLSGMVNMSKLGSDGQITFDCIFVVNVD